MHLVVASYNIHRGVGLDRRRDLDRVAAVIDEIVPDVIGLQEVVREDGHAHADQAAYLAELDAATSPEQVTAIAAKHGRLAEPQ